MSRSIQDIEGIGPKYAQLLNQAGIRTTGKLLVAGGNRAGRRSLAERTSINEKNILKWVNMADLFRVKGVAGQFAELLEGAGVDTVKELRNRNADNLAEKMAEVNKKEASLQGITRHKNRNQLGIPGEKNGADGDLLIWLQSVLQWIFIRCTHE